jgi:multimeric flavodoxin WrbA
MLGLKNRPDERGYQLAKNVLILFDHTATHYLGVNWLSELKKPFGEAFLVQEILLNSSDLKPCMGCFGCWVKTPGKCVITTDSADQLSNSFIHADTVILLSKVTYGGYSADIKAFLDRSIVNISPIFIIKSGEMHHKKRYPNYPDLVAFGYGDMTADEADTFETLAERNALNLHSQRHIALTARNRGEMEQAAETLQQFLTKAGREK